MKALAIAFIARDRFSSAPDALRAACVAAPRDTAILVADPGYPKAILAELGAIARASQLSFDAIDVGKYGNTNHAWNQLIPRVRADLVLSLENDVLLEPNAITCLLAALQNSGADVAVVAIYEPDGSTIHFLPRVAEIQLLNGGGRQIRLDRGRTESAPVHEQPYGIELFERHAFLLSTQTARALGDLDELMFCRTDIDLSLACHAQGKRVIIVPTARARLSESLSFPDAQFYDFRWDIHRVTQANSRLIAKWNLIGYKRTIAHAHQARERLDNLVR